MTTLNAQNIALRVEELEKSFAEINMTSQGIISTVSDLSNSMSKISQTSNSIVSTVESLDENMEKSASSIEQYSNKIKYSVTQGNFGSTLEQNPTSFLATFNQCSKYALLDDTEGLKLGDRTTGSYSKVRYDGHLEMFVEGEKYPYFCISYGERVEGCNCPYDNNYTLVASRPLPARFNAIPTDQITAICSISKLNDSSDGDQTLCYWSGVYCKVVGSDTGKKSVAIYGMSTWRDYDVQDGVFEISSPRGGMIDVSFIAFA